jgi:hypothetical protein
MNPVEEPHDLTPMQRKYLQHLWGFCRTPPTLARIYQKNVPRYLLLGLGALLLIYVAIASETYEAAWLIGGACLGVLLRDYATFAQAIKLWPATSAILDREALAELIQEHADDSDPDDWS